MKETLQQRIDSQEEWTFAECVALADEFGMKVRMVVVTVFSRGKRYIDRDFGDTADSESGAS